MEGNFTWTGYPYGKISEPCCFLQLVSLLLTLPLPFQLTSTKGLNVRINLATGKKEARIIPSEDISNEGEDEVARYYDSIDEIKDDKTKNMLKFLPAGEVQFIKESKYTPEQLKEIAQRLWEKRQAELQEVMKGTMICRIKKPFCAFPLSTRLSPH